jgi:ATP-dependent DNA helicase DinG
MARESLADLLAQVTRTLAAAEDRPAQRRMVEGVGEAIRAQRHLVVQAGTGTGKSLGYLVPALALGTRCVVATATKALQDQLATRDLPLVAESLGTPVHFAVLKGRSNYVCRQRVAEISGGGDQLALEQLPLDGRADGLAEPGHRAADGGLGPLGREIRRLVAWANDAETGDRADLAWEPSPSAWAQVSVGPQDCPGARRCPSGSVCCAEAARRRAADSDVVIVNTHLYAAHLAAHGEVLPPHDLVVFDEAHELEDIASASLGFDLSGGRLRALARSSRSLLIDPGPADAVDESARLLGATLVGWLGHRLRPPVSGELAERVRLARERSARLAALLRQPVSDGSVEAARRSRALEAATHVIDDLDQVLSLGDDQVAWVEGPDHAPVLRVAPIDVGATLAALLWSRQDAPTAVLTSATVPPELGRRIGLPDGSWDELDVGSPFHYEEQALLYCPLHLPDPRRPGSDRAMIDELVSLITAAGGRTLALFTSWRAMQAALEAVRGRVPWTVLGQSDLPKPALVARFSSDEHSCLFATMGFWQGVDIPGPALSLVTIDRLPFPRPDDPLLQARRERLGARAFATIDVPRAATLLAQGVGRLIRAATDRGVVAVLDPRLGTARYRWDLIRALPPMRRTRERSEVVDFLSHLDAAAPPATSGRSVAEPLEGGGALLPVAVDLHDELQPHTVGQLLPGADAGLLQHRAAPADDDRLL